MTTHLQEPQQESNPTKKFRSPKRVLVALFLKSRDQWKQKYMDIKKEIKRMKVRVHDVTKSREHWEQKYQEQKQLVKELQGEVQELQTQAIDSKKKHKLN